MEDKFKITEADQRKLIIDLLIRVTTENTIIRQNLKFILGHLNPNLLSKFDTAFQTLYKEENLKMRENIFRNYGHIDLDDILGE